MDVKSFLKSIPEFSELRDEDLERASAIARVGQAKANELIDVQGQPANKFYILVSGRLGVVLDLDFGVTKKSYVVTTVGPGHVFAWSGIIGNPHYTASGRALTDCTFLEFDSARLQQAFDEDPKLGYVVMRVIAQAIASRLWAMQLQLAQQYALSQVE